MLTFFHFLYLPSSGALHALETMDDIEKVCVIDFDVHHGNGTEEIARSWTNRHKREQMMRSSSLSDKKANILLLHSFSRRRSAEWH